ncbi:unnamed protein product [Toxocara canis]|uniref:Uncharacterized protein n=1 Tax=Toxocara canis TaxID=6265 RepID=A0A183VHA1_TOXCA|nr:unnamed protein product [Toxocara canis]
MLDVTGKDEIYPCATNLFVPEVRTPTSFVQKFCRVKLRSSEHVVKEWFCELGEPASAVLVGISPDYEFPA